MGDKGNEYAVPKPGRLNLRETNTEREARLRRIAEKEFKKYDEGTRRANGIIIDDHPIAGPSGLSHFTNLPSTSTNKRFGSRVHFDQDDFEPSLALPQSGHGHHGHIPIPIPSRHIHTHMQTHTFTSTSTSTSTHTHTHTRGHHTTTFTTSHTSNMNDEESVRYMKRQMEFAREQTLRAEAELLAGEKRRREEMKWRDELAEEERREKRREKREARERKERMEDQKARDRERERERGDTPEYTYTYSNHGNGSRQHTHGSTSNVNSTAARRKEQDRQRYLSRWKSLLANPSSSDDEIIEVELTYSDIPWPIYNSSSSSSSSHLLDKLTKESIKTFLSDLSATSTGTGISTGTGGKHELKRILREAIKNFHPDRFTSKVLIRVRGEEREKVREGMEICSRALTDLIGENARS